MSRFRTSSMNLAGYAAAIIAGTLSGVLAGALYDWASGDGFRLEWSSLPQAVVFATIMIAVLRYLNRPAPEVEDYEHT